MKTVEHKITEEELDFKIYTGMKEGQNIMARYILNPESYLSSLKKIRELCPKYNIEPPKDGGWMTPANGSFVDWFCVGENEKEFGGKRHDLSRQFVELYNEYKDSVDNGKGLKEQVKRTIHTICNPLGLNYMDEAYICFSRGLICVLFRFFSFNKAVWIYKNIFRQKY